MEMSSNKPTIINEKTLITLSISSWSHVAVLIATLVGIYFMLRSDVQAATTAGKQNQQDIAIAQGVIQEMRMDVRSIQENLNWFRKQYEADMARYIRDAPSTSPRR